MSININGLTKQMVAAGEGLAGDVWEKMQNFAVPELKKIAVQIEALARPDSPWSIEESKLLFGMQIRSAVSVIVAMTSLTLLAVQNAINAILSAVQDTVNTAIGFPLI